ncbi:MAG: hypothetical protein L0J57_00085 [Brachybacterium sp.]|nr:hypothetical protein [Brachybacterium sp.]
MSMRSRALLIGLLFGAIVVGVVLALLINGAVGGTGGRGGDPDPPAPPCPSPESSDPGAGTGTTDSAQPANDELAAGIQQEAADFLAAYTGDDSDSDWIEALTPLTTPEMLASLATSDRGVAQSFAGAKVGDPQSSQVPVLNGGETVATIHLVQIPEGDQGIITEATPWHVNYIDFTAAPEGAALPLSKTSDREIATAIQPALASVLAQPGGLTDKDRKAQIAESFTDADEALTIKRNAGPDQRITMGNLHDVQLGTDEEGNLVAVVVVPWVIDGEPTAQWTTLTVTLGRGSAGNWVAVDAATA